MEAGTVLTSPAGAGPGQDGDTSGPQAAPLRRLPDPALIVPAAVTLAVMLWGLSARAYWGDEADTVSAVSRSLPQLVRLLRHIDAVHGLYYLLLWPVAAVAGVSEFATRLPSAVAMAAAALGVAAIGRRLRSRRAGLCAGLVFAALPEVTVQGHDARPYALVTAVAVLASLLLIRAVDDPRPFRFAAYGLSLVALGYLELLALLLVAAHAITVIGLAGRGQDPHRPGPIPRRALARRWLVTIAAALVACAPVVAWGWLQRTEIAWITKPAVADVRYLAAWLSLGAVTSAALMGLLAVLGSTGGDPPAAAGREERAGREGRAGRAAAAGLTWLAVPWLVLPPVTLMAVSEIKPVYSFRYVVFCLPAVALLAGAGLASLRWAGRAAAAGLIVALALPAQLGLRVQGSGMRTAAGVLAARSQPGDAVIYPGTDIPPWYLAYPQAFGHLHDIGMAQSGAAAGRLYGTTVPLPVLLRRESGFSRIWVIEPGPGWQDPGRYLAPGFRLVYTFRPGGGVWLGLYQRLPETSARVTGPAPGTGGRTAQL